MTSCWLILFILGSCSREGNGCPLQYSCLENPMDRGAGRATVHGTAKSETRLSDWTPHTHTHAHTHARTHTRVSVVIRTLLDEIKSRHVECPGISKHFVRALVHGARLLLRPDWIAKTADGTGKPSETEVEIFFPSLWQSDCYYFNGRREGVWN